MVCEGGRGAGPGGPRDGAGRGALDASAARAPALGLGGGRGRADGSGAPGGLRRPARPIAPVALAGRDADRPSGAGRARDPRGAAGSRTARSDLGAVRLRAAAPRGAARGLHVAGTLVALGALAYVAVYRGGLVGMLLETLRAGPE